MSTPLLGQRTGTPMFALASGGVLVASGIDLVELSVGVRVMNALPLSIVLGLLFVLARRTLPAAQRPSGGFAWAIGTTIAMTAGVDNLFDCTCWRLGDVRGVAADDGDATIAALTAPGRNFNLGVKLEFWLGRFDAASARDSGHPARNTGRPPRNIAIAARCRAA